MNITPVVIGAIALIFAASVAFIVLEFISAIILGGLYAFAAAITVLTRSVKIVASHHGH